MTCGDHESLPFAAVMGVVMTTRSRHWVTAREIRAYFLKRMEFLVMVDVREGLSYPNALEFVYCLLKLFRNSSTEPRDNRVAMIGDRDKEWRGIGYLVLYFFEDHTGTSTASRLGFDFGLVFCERESPGGKLLSR